ncbi:hypothetical protein BT69DRAFT_1264957 [Atractiella rhizophila]|nr:hypothetical protein BT69DRAFT_1264957 [Atractiella rhizophila]
MNHFLCDNEAFIQSAAQSLGSGDDPIVAFDAEGLDLGDLKGMLSIMSCYSLSSESVVYLIDAVSVAPAALEPIFKLLRDKKVTKVLWDGRMDQSELWNSYGVKMEGCLDLQLADVLQRSKVEGWDKRVDRLVRKRYTTLSRALKDREMFGQIHALRGLKETHHQLFPYLSNTEYTKFKHEQWMVRPLSTKYLKYAAEDALKIAKIYHDFKAASYLDEATVQNLFDQTARYLSPGLKGRNDFSDKFRAHALLPLEILDPSPDTDEKIVCSGCQRALSGEKSFRKAEKDLMGREKCFVCRVIAWKNGVL